MKGSRDKGLKGSVWKRNWPPQHPSVAKSPTSQPRRKVGKGSGEGKWGGGGKEPWKEVLLIGPMARTKGRKRLKWALRATGKLWEVGGPQPILGQSSCPSCSPQHWPEMPQPHQPTTGKAKGGSGLGFGPSCRRWSQQPCAPTPGEPRPQHVPWAQRPRWGSRGHGKARETQTATSKTHCDLSAPSFPQLPTPV